jgi:hypothetical protein
VQNESHIGCDYYAVDPDVIVDGAGGCFAAFVANTWNAPIAITVDRGGVALDASKFAYTPSGAGQAITYAPLPGGMLPPGQVAILFLSQNGAFAPCPSGVTVAQPATDAAIHGTGLGSAFHVSTSAPIVAYDIFPYGGGQSAVTSATLLLPTSAWGTNYVAVEAYRKSTAVPQAQPSLDIVAAQDGTQVKILPNVAIAGGNGVAAAPANMAHTYTVNKGQILQLTQDAELSGSVIQSDQPIAVWGAASCMNIDVGSFACDAAHQQILPVQALGSEYVAVRYRNRFDGAAEETPPWRFVGLVDGTTLTYDPPGLVGAPTTLAKGQATEFRAAGPFVVTSQDAAHPFYLSAHMTGCQEVDPSFADSRGDPEFVNVVPALQFLPDYTFFTDPTYPETNLVVVRATTPMGFQDVTLDCAGTLVGWQPVGNSGKYEYTRIDLVRHDFQPQGGCDNGRHQMSSTAPFGLTIWGWGSAETGGTFGMPGNGFYTQAVSYGYPAGSGTGPINSVVIPVP